MRAACNICLEEFNSSARVVALFRCGYVLGQCQEVPRIESKNNELLTSKELNNSKNILESTKMKNDDFTIEIVALKEKLVTATRSWS
ncbi:hypothetical protein MAM1_0083d04613 [Mucor ambiguus]|uniref:Uncharacterized protein n=1 Tax=Mucor ambiguus TaxID=91626 RepID=A0A0C9MCP2_9FUNG|nr:hypothetical protein MAM1_0083d04613 [Mucor ambiguus]